MLGSLLYSLPFVVQPIATAFGQIDRALFDAASMLGASRSRVFTAVAIPLAWDGIVAGAGRGYVAQKHPDGRITFVDFKTGSVRTLTGFELASQVVDGSKP